MYKVNVSILPLGPVDKSRATVVVEAQSSGRWSEVRRFEVGMPDARVLLVEDWERVVVSGESKPRMVYVREEFTSLPEAVEEEVEPPKAVQPGDDIVVG